MVDYEVIDNFLSQEQEENLNNLIFNSSGDSKLALHYVNDVNISVQPHQFAFGRLFVEFSKPTFENSLEYIDPIMYELCKRTKENVQVSRAKINLFTKTNINEGLGMHYDLSGIDNYSTIIYYFNDNNGGTRFSDGTFIEQKKNRALIIHGRVLHESVTQTDTKIRVNININYVKVPIEI